jgi:hypothetical protein
LDKNVIRVIAHGFPFGMTDYGTLCDFRAGAVRPFVPYVKPSDVG